ncbi:lysophospholipid acyltransferase family protein [Streptomyces sp. NBC_00647]|uniref:lysophospholipid acyltransferase family protein n=1 Tax=Streptomyces sp. NBC_00647 TaxID=2975796 RepID=UPI00386927BF
MRNIFPGPVIRTVYGPDAEGLENVPSEGAAVIVSNHLSYADPGFLQLAVNRQLVFVTNVRLFRRRGLSGHLMRKFMNACEAVPVDPTGGSAVDSLVNAARTSLTADQLFCLYPEGGISRDGRLHKGKTGVGRVVLATGATVVPVAILNTDLILPPARRAPALQRARIRVGRPLDFSGWSASPEDWGTARAVTDEIMRELHRLSGRDYVDRYVH